MVSSVCSYSLEQPVVQPQQGLLTANVQLNTLAGVFSTEGFVKEKIACICSTQINDSKERRQKKGWHPPAL
jgi:hypothetical protein